MANTTRRMYAMECDNSKQNKLYSSSHNRYNTKVFKVFFFGNCFFLNIFGNYKFYFFIFYCRKNRVETVPTDSGTTSATNNVIVPSGVNVGGAVGTGTTTNTVNVVTGNNNNNNSNNNNNNNNNNTPKTQNNTTGGGNTQNNNAGGTKRYNCQSCPYSTDRRDLFTRHENIHKDEKPFHCYACLKQFNRADHVKKHFLRMHRELVYDINKTRRNPTTR